MSSREVAGAADSARQAPGLKKHLCVLAGGAGTGWVSGLSSWLPGGAGTGRILWPPAYHCSNGWVISPQPFLVASRRLLTSPGVRSVPRRSRERRSPRRDEARARQARRGSLPLPVAARGTMYCRTILVSCACTKHQAVSTTVCLRTMWTSDFTHAFATTRHVHM